MSPPEDEPLTTGWEPDVPPADTIVRQAVLVHASWVVEQARRAGRPWQREPGWVAAHLNDRAPMSNLFLLLQPPPDPADVLAELASFFPSHVPAVLLTPWPLGDLRRHGLSLVGHPPLMVHFPAHGLAAHPAYASPPGVSVRAVHNPADVATVERVAVEGFPIPELSPPVAGELLPAGLFDGDTRAWLAEDGTRPVATAVAYLGAGVTLVQFVATLPADRSRGAGAAVTWAATMADPVRRAVLLSSDPARQLYERLGYVALERWTIWLRPGG